MRCAYCNSDIPENSRFCPVCGAKQDLIADVQSVAAASSADDILADIQANEPAPSCTPPAQEPVQSYVPPVQEPVQSYVPPVQSYYQPAQTYAPPAQDYTQPVQDYTQPVQDYTQPAQSYTQPAAPLKASKKKSSKKGLIIGLCAGLALLAAAVLLYFLVFAGSPVTRALNGTLQDGSAMLHAGNLGKVVSKLESVGKSGKSNVNLAVDASALGDTKVTANLDLNADAKATMFGGALDFTFGEAGGVIRFVGDKTGAQLTAEGMDGVYGLSYADALEQLGYDRTALDGLQFATDEVTLAALKKGPLKPFFDSMKTEEVGQTRITTDGGDKICTHYTLTWDPATLEKLSDEYEAYDESGLLRMLASSDNVTKVSYLLASALADAKPTAELYIAGGKLLGADLTEAYGTTTYLRFLGGKNVWEHVRITDSEGYSQTDLYWEKAGTLRVCVGEESEQIELLHYEDATGAFTCGGGDLAAVMLEGTIGTSGSAATLNAAFSGDAVGGDALRATLTVQPMSDKLSLFGTDYTDLLHMSGAQQEKLMNDLNSALKLDKIGDLFSGLDALSGLSGDDEDPGEVTLFPGMDVDLGDDDTGISLPTPSGDVTESDLAGTFYLDHLAAGDVEYGLDLVGMSKDDNYITLGADGTGAIVLEGITVEIKWSYDGTTLSIADLEDDGELPYTLVVFDKDTIALDAESAYFVYVRD